VAGWAVSPPTGPNGLGVVLAASMMRELIDRGIGVVGGAAGASG